MPSIGSVSSASTALSTPAYNVLAFYYTFKFILVLWMALPATSGAQLVFRSVIQPMFSRFFSKSETTAANLRSKTEQATKSQ